MTDDSQAPLQPILVLLVWRGAERFQRALDSLQDTERFFKRIVISITSEHDSEDVAIAKEYVAERAASGRPSRVEVICTGKELPTMRHQEFWIKYLVESGAQDSDWVYWLAYDDQVFRFGLEQMTAEDLSWPLQNGFAYFGPWAMRHEASNELWFQDFGAQIEIWTSFPKEGPLKATSLDWITQQLLQPTYMQMSGSVVPLANHRKLLQNWPRKRGPMRIEMATASFSEQVAEFPQAVSIIYGRGNSDRANYAGQTRREDIHLGMLWLRKCLSKPMLALKVWRSIAKLSVHNVRRLISGCSPVAEEWRVRGQTTDG